MGNLRGQEWLIILIIVLVLFGGSRLPALARSFGKSARILREEIKGDAEDGDKGTGTATRDSDDDGDKPRG